MQRLEAIRANLGDRLREAKEQGSLGEVAAYDSRQLSPLAEAMM
jgi:hypothetical protein